VLRATCFVAVPCLALLAWVPGATNAVRYLREAGPCRSTTIPGSEVLSAHFWRGASDTLVAGYGESAVIAGTLTTATGTPLAGATLCVEEQQIGAGAAASDRVVIPRTGLAQTDGNGNYVYRLPAGPNREVVVVYRDGLGETTAAVRYFAPAGPTLRIAPRRTRNDGRPVRFWGKLPGPQARGRVVVLQVARGSNGWITFRQMTTDSEGRFESSYRFNRTFYDYTYTFRALVPRQAGYPWLAGASPLVPVEVKG
jgi:hypothetical protein